MKRAAEEVAEYRGEIDAAARRIRAEWIQWVSPNGEPDEPPPGYEESVEQWLKAGLSVDQMVQLVAVAQGRRVNNDHWRYFAGCCWRRITQLQDRAREILNEEMAAQTAELV
jgi:hypothetical protein